MPSFPRTVEPQFSSIPTVPGGILSVGQTGKLQTRSELAMGRMWSERWGAIKAGAEDVEELLAFIERAHSTLFTFDILHSTLPGCGNAINGAGGGTPLVRGADQSGESLVTDGWTASTTVLKIGDCFEVAGLNQLFRTVSYSDVVSNGSGIATITINPPILAGSSPADNAAIDYTAVTMRAIVLSYQAPPVGADEFIGGLVVTFREAP